MTPHETTLFLYNITLFPIIFFSVLYLTLTLIHLSIDKRPRKYPKLSELPFVSVQIPSFNDPIAERCIKHCLAFDYPKDKYEIVIVDDSTNEETRKLLASFTKRYKRVKFIHRTNREGYKPGALRNAMKITKGEIIVVFDADWMPAKDFLRKIVKPFADPNVAIVQSRQGFYNRKTNLITRFAAYTLMVYHTIVMPINDRVNTVFFCGTAGALRRSAFEEVGGWNTHSITEDSELSVKLLMKGYKSVYLGFETPSEVPDTFESFLKQQMRWCYGNARVFLDNFKKIMFTRDLKPMQKIMISFITLANAAAPFVVLMTIFGFAGWFIGEPQLFQFSDLITMFLKIAYTAGFIIMGTVTLWKQELLDDLGRFVLSALTVGIVMSVSNSYAFVRAIFNKGLSWYCTPKIENAKALE